MDNNHKVINLKINGVDRTLMVKTHWTLLNLLRDELGIMGVKCGCNKGECGACTVLMDGYAVLACLTLAVAVDGKEIVTIEGLAENGNIHPVQQSFIDQGAIQCGFCTPGMVLTAKALLDENPHPSEEEIRSGINGNICRCTGYARIVAAIQDAASRSEVGGVV